MAKNPNLSFTFRLSRNLRGEKKKESTHDPKTWRKSLLQVVGDLQELENALVVAQVPQSIFAGITRRGRGAGEPVAIQSRDPQRTIPLAKVITESKACFFSFLPQALSICPVTLDTRRDDVTAAISGSKYSLGFQKCSYLDVFGTRCNRHRRHFGSRCKPSLLS